MDTLVLNMYHEADRIVTWQEAFVLVMSQRAEVLEEYTDRTVNTINQTFKVPSVIKFTSGKRHISSSLRFSKNNIYARDNGMCQYCGKLLNRNKCTFDHIKPRSRGGKTCWNNIVLACLKCNQRKADKSLSDTGLKLIKKPSVPKFIMLSVDKNQVYPDIWYLYSPNMLKRVT